MSRSYYYLVAGLPDLLLDEGKSFPSFGEIAGEMASHMESSDAALVAFVRYPFDNRNVARLLTKGREPFDPRGNFSEEELAAEVKAPDRLPAYMVEFLEEHREGRDPYPGFGIYDQLMWSLLAEAFESDNVFVREWFEFDSDLRNVLTAVNVREHAGGTGLDMRRELERALVGRTTVTEQILKAGGADVALSGVAPWVERLLSVERHDLVGFEKTIDELRWRMLDELTIFADFQVETILAFLQKLLLVERWMALDPVEGKQWFDRLVEQMKTGATAMTE
jgi:hypothetical protein